jgi:hypothetical protein
MSDPGLREAIRAAGGVTELARRVGVSQPSISNWSRIPAERVLAVEAATGIARFFADLEAARGAQFYLPVGTIGRIFIEIETQAFALPG